MGNKKAIAAIIRQSSTLAERVGCLQSRPRFSKKNNSRGGGVDFIQLWKDTFNKDALNYFEKRLLFEGIKQNDLEYLAIVRPEIVDLQWPDLLGKIIDEILLNKCKYTLSDILTLEKEIEFEDFFVYIIKIAESELLVNLTGFAINQFLTENGFNDLKKGLLTQLSDLCSNTLFHEFQKQRSKGSELLSKFLDNNYNPDLNSRDSYNSFIEKLHADGGLAFFKKYAVLSKLISITVQNWIAANSIFIKNIIDDFERIVDFFEIIGLPGQSLKIDGITLNLSDKHHSGKSVYIIEFTNADKIVYKPKSLEIDLSYNMFLEWINKQNFSPPIKTIKILNGSDNKYGYCQFVEHKACTSQNEVDGFYIKSGALLCVLHILRATDCHFENLIARKGDLVLVDCETLLQPTVRPSVSDSLISGANPDYFNSVLRTDFLPVWKFDHTHKFSYDISGIGPVDDENNYAEKETWINVNTDEMAFGFVKVQRPVSKNIPIFNNIPVNSCHYLDEIKSGFQSMYEFFIGHKQILTANGSPLYNFQKNKNRFIFRATEVYGYALRESKHPKFLENGLFYSIKLDLLSRAHLWPDEKNKLWDIYKAELDQLNNLDIPYFNITTDSNDLEIIDTNIETYFSKNGYEDMLATISNLSQSDLKNQIDVIEGALLSRNIIPNTAIKTASTNIAFDHSGDRLIDQDQLINEAIKIADAIMKRSINDNGRLTWRPLVIDVEANRFQYKPIGLNLYSGKCGIALFLSALFFITNDFRYKDFSLKCIDELMTVLTNPNSTAAIKGIGAAGLGVADGIGSIIYSLVKTGVFLGDNQVIEAANNAASLLSEELIQGDTKFDIVNGCAGCVLSLLQLFENTGDQNLLTLAKVCGDHLVACQKRYKSSPPAWSNGAGEPLTGFSHGAAGISYALLMLFKTSAEPVFKEAAIQGIKYEQSRFDKINLRYPDFRRIKKDEKSNVLNSWCNGFSGITLGRLGGLPIYSDQTILNEIRLGIYSVLNQDLHYVDHLCCGNFGRLETMLFYGIKNDAPEIVNKVQISTGTLIKRAAKEGGYLIHRDIPHKFVSPGFFQGLSGIGYQLLRIAAPSKIPSILLFN